MTHPLVDMTETLVQLCATHTVITANERLASEFTLGYDHHLRACGQRGWQTLKCMSLRRFLIAEFHRCIESQQHTERLVATDELLALAFTTAPSELSQMSTLAHDALRTVQRYRIDRASPELASSRGLTFKHWADEMLAGLAGAVVEDEIGDFLRANDWRPQQSLLLVEIEQLTPIEKDYLQFAQQSVDVLTSNYNLPPKAIDFLNMDTPVECTAPGESELLACKSLQEEVANAAQWAYQLMATASTSNPPRIGIVIPNLADHYDLVQRQFAATLDPHNGSATTIFDIAAGRPLAQQPVWVHARALLEWTQQSLGADAIRGLARSPFLRLGFLDGLVANWPPRLRKHLSLGDLHRDLRERDLPERDSPDKRLDNLATRIKHQPRRARLSSWVEYFRTILELVGWPNSAHLQSFQFQAHEAVLDGLQRAVSLDGGAQLNGATALRLIDTLLAARTFAPQRVHADIHILGLLETTGLTFTHLWVTGMDADNFPRKASSNPFLPRALLARYGVPRSSQTDELRFAKSLMARWTAQAIKTRFSYTNTHEESERRPTAMLVASKTSIANTHLTNWHPFFVASGVALDTVIDANGTSLDAGDTTGGVGFLREQSHCPFRAYAMFRLNLREPRSPMDFPDALSRGIAMHEALASLFQQAPSQADLLALQHDEIDAVVDQTLQRLQMKMPSPFLVREQRRISENLNAWIALEAQRGNFTAIHIEEAFTIDLEGLRFSVRVDRIDETADGLWVLDYKTGQIQLGATDTTSLAEPQLPVYSLLIENIQGVYYAQLREGSVRIAGIAASPLLSQARTMIPKQSWESQLRQWRVELGSIARQIATGDARVEPTASACDYCHLKSFCRIGEPQ